MKKICGIDEDGAMNRNAANLRGSPETNLRRLLIAAAGSICTLFVSSAHAQDLTIVSFGSGTLSGTYRGVAGAICDEANASGQKNLRCSPETTPGSVYNLFAIQRGELDFALVQSDWQRSAVEGTGPFSESGPMQDLRGVMALYPEAVTLVVRRDAGISSIRDISGKVVDIGAAVTARRVTNDRLLEVLGLSLEDMAKFQGLAGSAVASEFCRGNIDATLLVLGHPNNSVASMISDCDGEIVPIAGPEIEALLAKNEDYSATAIAAGTYPEVIWDAETFSVTATMVTRAGIPNEMVEYLASAVLDNLSELQSLQPVLKLQSNLDKQTDGMTAPLHPAVEDLLSKKDATQAN